MFIASGCDDHIEKVDVSSSWNSIMTKLEKSESALTTINPINRGGCQNSQSNRKICI